MISAVVLAAGRAQRMGEQKLLLPLRHKPVLQWVLESVLASRLHEVICVVRDLGSLRRHVALVDERLFWLVNPIADRGLSTSVIAGLWAIHPESDGALFLVGDQPLICGELINALVERFEKSNALIVAPISQGEARNPVLFRRDLFPDLLTLTGDRGGKGLLEKFRAQAEFLEWQDHTPFLDIDTRKDYESLMRLIED